MEAGDNALYFTAESAGGISGGFSIFAYNAKDLTTPVADQNNDRFTDGTFSCATSCHISFIGKLRPSMEWLQ